MGINEFNDMVQNLVDVQDRKKDMRTRDFGDSAAISGDIGSQCDRVASSPSLRDSQMVRKKKKISHLLGSVVHIYLHIHSLSIMYIQLFIHFFSKHSWMSLRIKQKYTKQFR